MTSPDALAVIYLKSLVQQGARSSASHPVWRLDTQTTPVHKSLQYDNRFNVKGHTSTLRQHLRDKTPEHNSNPQQPQRESCPSSTALSTRGAHRPALYRAKVCHRLLVVARPSLKRRPGTACQACRAVSLCGARLWVIDPEINSDVA